MTKFKTNELPRSSGFRYLMHRKAKFLETGVDVLPNFIDFLGILSNHTIIVNMRSSSTEATPLGVTFCIIVFGRLGSSTLARMETRFSVYVRST